jgi:hypothetical protein
MLFSKELRENLFLPNPFFLTVLPSTILPSTVLGLCLF